MRLVHAIDAALSERMLLPNRALASPMCRRYHLQAPEEMDVLPQQQMHLLPP